jgi:hypothetical protein
MIREQQEQRTIPVFGFSVFVSTGLLTSGQLPSGQFGFTATGLCTTGLVFTGTTQTPLGQFCCCGALRWNNLEKIPYFGSLNAGLFKSSGPLLAGSVSQSQFGHWQFTPQSRHCCL